LLTFGTIAAGAPSAMAPMTKHMLTQTVPREVADLARYYTQSMEVGQDEALPRRDMHPVVAKGLGIDPDKPVTADQINALLAGRRADGEKIEGKTYSELREYTDPKTGELKTKVPIGAVDFCFTPDKSVSVAWAFGTPAEQSAIYQAHRDAGQEAMRYVEQEIAKAGIGKGGKGGFDQGHLGWISFDHYTSRPTLWVAREENGQRITESVPIQIAGDPELHTHFTVSNAVFCSNGRVGSLDLDRLEGFIKEAGALYQAHVAQNLRDMGAEVVLDQDTGAARLTAIPDDIRSHFSKRTTNGEQAAREFAKAQGLDWDDLSSERRAGLLKAAVQGIPKGLDDETIGKLKKDDMADFADWRRQAEDLGWKHESVISRNDAAQEITREQRIERAYAEALPWFEKDLDKRAVVSEHDARTAIARGLIASGIESHRDIDLVMAEFESRGVRQQGEMTTLIAGQEHDKRGRSITTGLHEMQEKEFIAKARAASSDTSDALPADRIKVAVERSGLDFTTDHGKQQLAAIHDLGEGGKLGVMIGAAGAGKTTLLQPLVSAWQEDDRRVYGIALAWRQADDLIDAGIAREDTKAISVFFKAVEKGDIQLDNKSVVVVDEMSLLGTRQALDLLRLQETHGFRMAMIGDDKQCQSIEAGPMIDLARKALGESKVPEILTTIRQQTERERDIAGAFRDGKATAAINMKREDRTAELVPGGYREAAERTAALLMDRIQANKTDPGFTITVSAPTNTDAHRLSVAIREKRREMGELGKDLVKIKAADRDGNAYEMKLASGDRVRLFNSVSAQGQRGGSIGRNGSILTVQSADKNGMTVRNAKGVEGYLPWKSLTKDGQVRLAYGEVMTTHTAQGSTATEHIYAMPAGTKMVNGFSAYSSGTRHKQRSFMIISEGAERAEVSARRPVNDPRPIRTDDAWANVARNLGRQPTKTTALDFIDRASGIKRGAAKSLQRGLQPGELRERRGQEATTVHTRHQRRQEARAVGRIAERMEVMGKDLQPIMDRLTTVAPRISSAVETGVERVVRTAAMESTSLRVVGHDGLSPARQNLRRIVQNIPREHIDEVKRSVSLTALVSQSVKLDHHGKGICPFHVEKTPSFHVDEKKGHYHCFGCGAHGDAVSWLTTARGLPFADAVAYLGGKSGKDLPSPQIERKAGKDSAPEWIAVQPVPAGVPPLVKSNGWTAEVYNPKAAERGLERTQKPYLPAHVAPYRDADGRAMGYVLRVEMADGGKFTPQVTWAVPSDAPAGADPAKIGRWALLPMQDPRPLYRGEEVAKFPDRNVVVVMGEKKADALQKKLGDSAVVVSWAGGDNGRFKTDFGMLAGRNVIIWPDADRGGKAAAIGETDRRGEHKKGAAEYIQAAGAASVKVIIPPAGVEKGWDAGDMIKSGANRKSVETFIRTASTTVENAKQIFGNEIRVEPQMKSQKMTRSRGMSR
jgi:hypothetical protein